MVKITIEKEDKPTLVFCFDSVEFSVNQDVYSFFKRGEFVAAECAPNGVVNISITGIKDDTKKRYDELCAEYPHVEKMG